MTVRELAMLLSTIYVLYPPMRTWADLESMWARTSAKDRRIYERKAAKILKLYAERSAAR